jgi:membrane protein
MAAPSRHISLRLLIGVWTAMAARNLDLIAAGVAFYAMLAVFPAIAAVIAFWGFVSDPVIVEQQLQLLQGLIPAEAFALLDTQVRALIAANSSTLGWTTIVSVGAALWSTRAGVGALLRGLNAVYGTSPRAGFWHSLAAVAMTFGLVALVLAALVAVVVVPVGLVLLPFGPAEAWALAAARWVLLFAVGMFGLWLVYRFGPNHSAAQTTAWVSPGAVFALILWALVSWGFSAYLANFGSYNRFYGSIGAVIVLLMWFFLSAWVVLLGATVNAELSRELAGEKGEE